MADVTAIRDGGSLRIEGAGFGVEHVDSLLQIVVTVPDGRGLGEVVAHDDDQGAFVTSGVPYEGSGRYTVSVHEFGTQDVLAEWTGAL